MRHLRPIVDGTRAPGIYRLASRAKPGVILAEADEVGWRGFYLDGRAIASKADFLGASADAMAFPAYFGQNWDAFEECINDLSWAPAQGYLLLFDCAARFVAQRPADWRTAKSILASAIRQWDLRGVPFYALLRGARRTADEIPRLQPASSLSRSAR